MAGEQLGRRLAQYVYGTPSTTLDFDYTEQELDKIRAGRIPDSVLTRIASRSAAVTGRALKAWLPLFLVFAVLAGVIAATAENGRVAVPLLLMGIFAVFAGIFFGQLWWNYRRPAKNRTLKVQALRAYKSTTDFSVRFGQTAMTGRSWSMDKTAFGLVNGDGLYNVYSAAGTMVYLEEVEERS